MGKNKKYSKQKTVLDQKPKTNIQTLLLEDEDQLRMQAIELFSLLQASDNLQELPDCKVCYLVSYNWFNYWKDYVSYQELIEGKAQKDGFGQYHPGIINEDIIDQNQSFLRFPEGGEYQYLNHFLLDNAIEKQMFIKVDYNTWEYLLRNYQGYQIQRPIFHKNSQNQADLDLIRFNLGFIHADLLFNFLKCPETLLLDNIQSQISFRKIQFSNFFTIQEIKQVFLQTIQEISQVQPNQWQISQHFNQECFIKIWYLDQHIGIENFHKLLLDQMKNHKLEQKQIRLRAKELKPEQFIDMPIKDFLKNQEYLLVEIVQKGSSSILVQQEISYNKSKTYKGYCQFCKQFSQLDRFCQCTQVLYCSDKCKYKDQLFHYKSCNLAFDSDSDLEENHKKLLSSQYRKGLINIANTCYMNSVMQCILHTKEFSGFFINKDYKKLMPIDIQNHYSPQQKKLFTVKFSKLLKKMLLQQDDNLEPWAFKQQLSFYYNSFRGSSQHDACEFLTILFNLIQEEIFSQQNHILNPDKQQLGLENNLLNDFPQNHLKNPEEIWASLISNNQSVIKDNFEGLLKSEITCLTCGYFSYQYDPFCILSLPLAKKEEEKSIEIYFIPYDLKASPVNLKCKFFVNSSKIQEIYQFVSHKLRIDEKNIILAVGNDENIEYFLREKQQLVNEKLRIIEIQKKILYAFQVPDNCFESRNDSAQQLIQLSFCTSKKMSNIGIDYEICSSISYPRLILVHKATSLKQFYEEMLRYFGNLYESFLDQLNALNQSWLDYQEQERIRKENEERIRKEEEERQKIEEENQLNEQEEEELLVTIKGQEYIIKQKKSEDLEQNQIPPTKKKIEENNLENSEKIEKSQNKINRNLDKPNMKKTLYTDSDTERDMLLIPEYKEILNYYYQQLPFQIKTVLSKSKIITCPLCGSKTCENCILKCSSEISIENLFNYLQALIQNKDFLSLQLFWKNNFPDFFQSQKIKEEFDQQKSKEKKTSYASLYDCLDLFTESEKLEESNAWLCPQCNQKKQAKKKILLQYSPKFLVIQLKRFKTVKDPYDKNTCKLKLVDPIEYPLDLDLNQYVSDICPHLKSEINNKSKEYELYGVVIHEGTIDRGHYYAYCQSEDKEWKKFDDHIVTILNNSNYYHKNAYLLFYRLKANQK